MAMLQPSANVDFAMGCLCLAKENACRERSAEIQKRCNISRCPQAIPESVIGVPRLVGGGKRRDIAQVEA